ncbi:MAG: SDR family NAD(P)-dependent oxidoreductase [Solirubrobacterales bacterium]|nr:SDR family NAD(P)-dependent oxidoreductase [Solirubrobacterales bacterium]
MDLDSAGALVSGGASGLGEATARRLHAAGAHVVIADLNADNGEALAADLGERGRFVEANVTDPDALELAVAAAAEAPRGLRITVGCAGIGWAQRVTGKNGPHPLDLFRNVVEVNLIGMFNLMRLSTTQMNANEIDEEGERGLFVSTASVAAFDGQIGQIAYSASKSGIVGMTLPAARDLSSRGIRVMAIAPGLFDTPLLAALPEPAREALGAQVPFPSRLGRPDEFAALVASIAENPMINGSTIRLDGAIRMPPR